MSSASCFYKQLLWGTNTYFDLMCYGFGEGKGGGCNETEHRVF